ncbi:MAG: DUF1857 family protein [Bryobacteraceae bacterium]|nr:DUF1857 family protein [Bryobacteraceae bacterium]
MPFGTYTTPINASRERIWEAFLDKARRPHRYIPYEVLDYKIHEEYPDGILREIRTAAMHMVERVKFDETAGTVTFTLVDHPLYEGYLRNQVSPGAGESGGLPLVTYTMDVKPKTPEADEHPDAAWFRTASQPEAVAKAVLHMKHILENESAQGAKA